MEITITKLERNGDGYWSARVTPSGQEAIPVTRRSGSWTTIPDPATGISRILLPFVAAALQERVRPLERREFLDAHARGEHVTRVRQCPECRKKEVKAA